MRYDDHLVLHGLAIKKYATAAEIAVAVGLQPEPVASSLAQGLQTSRVARIGERYSLLPAGLIMLKGEYSRHYGPVRRSPAFLQAYERFAHANEDLKALITSWQVREVAGAQLPNDHADEAYDAKIIDRLGDLHERFEPTLEVMVAELPRLAVYPPKLEHALEQAELGETAWISEVRIPSYHTVWFELHEDLLLVLGRSRVES